MFDVSKLNVGHKITGDKVLVIGVGGGGCNAIDYMLSKDIKGVQYLSCNTDQQALESKACKQKLLLGWELTKGIGAGSKPEVGKNAAIESREKIVEIISPFDLVFITAGMGGGTGTGAAPVIAKIAKEEGIVSVAVVTRPFSFELRDKNAQSGLSELASHADSLIVIPNDKLQPLYGSSTLSDAFAKIDEVLFKSTRGIAELITNCGNINIDISDIKKVVTEKGLSTVAVGEAQGPKRASEAFRKAITSPLIETSNFTSARGIVAVITSDPSISIEEYELIGKSLNSLATEEAHIILGTTIDFEVKDEIRLTILLSGVNLNDYEMKHDDYFDIESFIRDN